jgi:hypothetical protein
MKNEYFKKLPNWENEVYLWIEQESSVMLKAICKSGDPVELTSADVRTLAKYLNEAADKLDNK